MRQNQFVNQVLAWQANHGRHDLPWQQPATPYRVLVSEIMLQQTQVTTVIPYFERWMSSFPTLQSLAAATEDQVMAHWQGLGYYSRARNLLKAARHLIEHSAGEFPDDLKELQEIPGVGRYTAGAIRSFAFDQYGPIVDGNVRRLFCRLFGIEGVPGTSVVDKELWRLAEELTPKEHNRRFAQGLLDLGATLCTPRNPNCTSCPLQADCVAFREQRQNELPHKKATKTIPRREAHFVLHLQADKPVRIRLLKRPPSGIWASLWCLPELDEAPTQGELVTEFTHTFSHFKMHGQVWLTQDSTLCLNEDSATQYVALEQLADFGLPAPFRALLPSLMQEI
ncbi:MAG: A/G-specific adenine glycosylase [Idiomarina sp.]|nr:A/G-specific adenine glycosylase [Idiomarina sp.]